MGSALTIPLSDNGHETNLWGTEYDKGILDVISKGKPHPRIDTNIPKSVKLFQDVQLKQALKDREVVVLGVSSGAIRMITKRCIPYMKHDMIFVTVAKGLSKSSQGILTVPEVIESEMPRGLRSRVVAIGGPSIARDLANKIPTAVVYASKDIAAAEACREVFSTPYYRIKVSDDIVGMELCAALKNVYAISVGWCNGIIKRKKLKAMDNTKALLFTQAIKEIEIIVRAMGGKTETVMDLSGVGDLEVTCRGGRNVMFGELLGTSLKSKGALEEMRRSGRGAVEGYQTTENAYELVKQLEESGKIRIGDVPLLREIYSVLYDDKDVENGIEDLLVQI